jgi:hypothetical protein
MKINPENYSKKISSAVRKGRVESEEGMHYPPPCAIHGYMPSGAVHWAGQVSGTSDTAYRWPEPAEQRRNLWVI